QGRRRLRQPEPPPTASQAQPAPVGSPCGALDCLAFDGPEQAFDYVLQQKPRVLAVGESHAQQRDPKVHSSTRRFGEELLPKLKGQATDIVIELMVGTGRCGKKREQAVAEAQKPVTQEQAKSNQNEFVTLGKAAQSFGIAPHPLEPTCEEFQAVLDAGDGDIARMLQLVADTTATSIEKLLDTPGADQSKLLLTYGGARHNDIAPRPQMEAWSFGPRLSQRTQGRYVELDLIVPEFIKDSEAWRALPWYSHYDAERFAKQTVLFHPEPAAYVLIFPRSEQ
ncbi:MAG TPA: hypothetical protein VM686_31235, partial [Polyangiaceae bacterium]|nr:hypothetical protein [Polyangiaceae bacterium]